MVSFYFLQQLKIGVSKKSKTTSNFLFLQLLFTILGVRYGPHDMIFVNEPVYHT